MDAQPRITDLIPQRITTFMLLFLGGLLVIAGLVALYERMPQLASMTSDGRVAAFDLDSEGSLGAWFSSSLLVAASLVALLVWSIRRHREDDYHGRYRIWFWAAAIWFVMSIDEACSLHEGFKEMMAHYTGERLWGDGSLWWVGAYVLVLGYVGLRLLLEMRSCRTSTTLLVLAGGSWVVAVLAQLGILLPGSGARGVMLEEACEMVGDLLLLSAMTWHARYIKLEVQGLLPQRKAKKRRKAAAAEEDKTATKAASGKSPARRRSTTRKKATTETEKSDARSNKPAASSETSAAKPAASAADKKQSTGADSAPSVDASAKQQRVDAAEQTSPNRKLSKAERRAQRKREREERRR